MKLFDDHQLFYKANFHTHTSESDGRLTPEESMRAYRERGYDILALTDHRKVTVPEHVPDGLLMIPGIEMDFIYHQQVIHLLGLGMDAAIGEKYKLCKTPQQVIHTVKRLGGRVILAHPAWSLNTPEYMASLKGLWGAEVWNSVSTLPYNAMRADSSSLLDVTASKGQILPMFANDDTHHYGSELAAGWNMIQAEELTVPAVMAAVDQGRMYATQGPEIHQIEVEQGVMRVSCSPAKAIVFYSGRTWVKGRSHVGEGLTSAEYTLAPADGFVRVQIIDAEGKSAWSSPVAVQKLLEE